MDYALSFMHMWNESNDDFPSGLKTFNLKEKKVREKRFESFLRKLDALAKTPVISGKMNSKEKFLSYLSCFFRDTLDYPSSLIQVIFSDEMVSSTSAFIREAKRFDPELGFKDIFQACRNVWIMNGLQYLMNKPVCLTPSVFAYSMLYPYTDNYLDDPCVSAAAKWNFSSRFEKRLRGEWVEAFNEREDTIFRLVGLIESSWERELYPGVYKSLLDIHDAQTQSTCLLSNPGLLGFEDSLMICIRKGGTSVVADGYLISGSLTSGEEEFLFYYGAFLQLLDDLQDTSEDLSDSLLTGFANAALSEKIDSYLNKTYHLGKKLTEHLSLLQASWEEEFKALLEKSTDLFLVETLVSNSSLFSLEFSEKFEAFSPLGFSFIQQKQHTLSGLPDQLFEQLFSQVLTGENEFSEYRK